MKKILSERLKGAVAGAVAASVLVGGGVIAVQRSEKIDVYYDDICIYVDGKKIDPKDANGNKVEPFIYNGTTYLPVRAVGNAFEKEVDWDGENKIVYLGKKPIRPDAVQAPVFPNGLDGNGKSIDIFLGYNAFDSDYIVEEETGDIVRDAIYNRNKAVEEKFDIKLNFNSGYTNHTESVYVTRALTQAGDDTYEAFINAQSTGMSLVYEGLFADWKKEGEMPHVNLDSPWWNPVITGDINYGGKTYAVSSSFNLHNLKSAHILSFNKTMMDELGLEYPYEMVLDGTWTIDEMIKMTKAAIKDLNGDGVMDPKHDRYGFSGWKYEMMPGLFTGMGGQAVIKDDNGLPMLAVKREHTYEVIDKILTLFYNGNGGWNGGDMYGVFDNMFKDSRLLFCDKKISSIPSLWDNEFDLGVVPYPKLSAEQESYRSMVANFSSLTFIPITNNDRALTSAVLEQMAYLSYTDVEPAFFEQILKGARDEETTKMVMMSADGRTFMNENYITAGSLIGFEKNGTNTLSSTCAFYADTWEQKMATMIEFWKE